MSTENPFFFDREIELETDVFRAKVSIIENVLEEYPQKLSNENNVFSNEHFRSSLEYIFERMHFLSGIQIGSDFLEDRRLTPSELEWMEVNHIQTAEYRGDNHYFTRNGRFPYILVQLKERDKVINYMRGVPHLEYFPHSVHIGRLLSHSNAPACHEFAIQVLIHYGQLANNPDWNKLTQIPSSVDGNESSQFWTYGPYVWNALREKGKNFEFFIQNWSLKRIPIKDTGNALYPGIEGLNYFADRAIPRHYLGKDGKGQSHKVADLIARKAVLPAILKDDE